MNETRGGGAAFAVGTASVLISAAGFAAVYEGFMSPHRSEYNGAPITVEVGTTVYSNTACGKLALGETVMPVDQITRGIRGAPIEYIVSAEDLVVATPNHCPWEGLVSFQSEDVKTTPE